MKIFVLSKKHIKIITIIAIIIFAAIILYFTLQNNQICVVEINSNSIISSNFRERIERLTSEKEKIAYLTFDDGPNESITPKVLDILKEQDVKATFFVIGKNVKEHPEVVKREYEEGHYIANHGYSHNNKNLYKSDKDFIEEVNRQYKLLFLCF